MILWCQSVITLVIISALSELLQSFQSIINNLSKALDSYHLVPDTSVLGTTSIGSVGYVGYHLSFRLHIKFPSLNLHTIASSLSFFILLFTLE